MFKPLKIGKYEVKYPLIQGGMGVRISAGSLAGHVAKCGGVGPAKRMLERAHNFFDVIEAVTSARKAGFTNLNLDLIYGLPGLDLETWTATVREVLAWGPDHVSAYGLTLDEGSLWHARGVGGLPPEEAVTAQYWALARAAAEAGFEHYEISNYARPGDEVAVTTPAALPDGTSLQLDGSPAVQATRGGRIWKFTMPQRPGTPRLSPPPACLPPAARRRLPSSPTSGSTRRSCHTWSRARSAVWTSRPPMKVASATASTWTAVTNTGWHRAVNGPIASFVFHPAAITSRRPGGTRWHGQFSVRHTSALSSSCCWPSSSGSHIRP